MPQKFYNPISHVLNSSSSANSQNLLHKTLGPIRIAFKMLIVAASRMWTFSLITTWIIFTDELIVIRIKLKHACLS